MECRPVGKVPFWLPQRGTTDATDVLDSPSNYLREKRDFAASCEGWYFVEFRVSPPAHETTGVVHGLLPQI